MEPGNYGNGFGGVLLEGLIFWPLLEVQRVLMFWGGGDIGCAQCRARAGKGRGAVLW